MTSLAIHSWFRAALNFPPNKYWRNNFLTYFRQQMSTFTKKHVLVKDSPLKDEFMMEALKDSSPKAFTHQKRHKFLCICLDYMFSSLISSFPLCTIRCSVLALLKCSSFTFCPTPFGSSEFTLSHNKIKLFFLFGSKGPSSALWEWWNRQWERHLTVNHLLIQAKSSTCRRASLNKRRINKQ